MKKLIFVLFIFLGLFLFTANKSFAQNVDTGKVIKVNLATQTLYAFDQGKIVYQTPISSGLWQSPTVTGTFHIYTKLPLQEMIGISPVHGPYDLPNVPNVMYFYQGYAIHGAYWHNNFGNPMSNGCINVPLNAAAWLYNFAPVGTTVVIY